MNINIKDVLSLDDNNIYVVTSKAELDSEIYCYLANINDNGKVKILHLDHDQLVEVDDSELVRKLIPLFLEETNKVIPLEELFNQVD